MVNRLAMSTRQGRLANRVQTVGVICGGGWTGTASAICEFDVSC
jgi:hypothetical protein